jgi:hypothetical protein
MPPPHLLPRFIDVCGTDEGSILFEHTAYISWRVPGMKIRG